MTEWPQPDISNSLFSNTSFTKFPPNNWQPSINQCGPTLYKDSGLYPQPSNCNSPTSSSTLAFNDINTQGQASKFVGAGTSESCLNVTPEFNWIISSCDSVGGIGGMTSVGKNPMAPPISNQIDGLPDSLKDFQISSEKGSACNVNP